MPGDFCGDSFAQNDVEITLISDQVEAEVSKIYSEIVRLQSDGQQCRETLMLYAGLRTDLDQVLAQLASTEPGDVTEEKRIILAGLTVAGQRLVLASLGCGGSCQSCALTLTESLREVLVTFNRKYITQTSPGNIQEDLRTDLLNLVGLYNELSREIFKKSSLGEKVGDCDRQKAKVWEKLK